MGAGLPSQAPLRGAEQPSCRRAVEVPPGRQHVVGELGGTLGAGYGLGAGCARLLQGRGAAVLHMSGRRLSSCAEELLEEREIEARSWHEVMDIASAICEQRAGGNGLSAFA